MLQATFCGSDILAALNLLEIEVGTNTFVLCKVIPFQMIRDWVKFQLPRMVRTHLDGTEEEIEVMLGAGVYSSAQGLEKYNMVAQAKQFLVDRRRHKVWGAMAEQEDAVRWVAEFLLPESFKSAPKNHALREDRARFVLEKQRHFDAVRKLRKEQLHSAQEDLEPGAANPEDVEVKVAQYLHTIQELRHTKCALCECAPADLALHTIPTDSVHAIIDDLRWDILDIDPAEDFFCTICLKWMHVYATCVIPRERTGEYADADTIPLALQSIVSMHYNEEEMQNCENADLFYNMADHSEEQISDTIAEVEPQLTELAQDIPQSLVPSPMPPVTPIVGTHRPLKVRRVDMRGL